MAQRADGDDLLYADHQLVITRTYAPAGLSLSGSVDAFNAEPFAQALVNSLQGAGDLTIDLHHLEFCDVSGIRALISAAKAVGQTHRLVLTGLPMQLRYVMTLVGWRDLPGLVIHDDENTY